MIERSVRPTSSQKSQECAGWRLLQSRDFGFLFAGQAISQIGDGLNRVALLWFVYDLTGSALKTTMIGLLQTLPPLLLGPIIGVYLDRWPKKRAMIWIDLVRTAMVALIPLLYAMHALTLERLYFLVFFTAVFSAVFGPALASAIPQIVSRAQLTSANALLQTTTTIGVLVGPAVSGIGIALIGAQNVLYLNAITFFVAALCLLPIRVREIKLAPSSKSARPSLVGDLSAGFRFVFLQNATIRALMIMTTLYTVGMSAFVFLLPVVAKQILHIGPMQLGWLWSALGVGMLVSSIGLAWFPLRDLSMRLRVMAGSLAIGGIGMCGLSLLSSTLTSAVTLLLIGSSTAIFIPLVWGVLQEMTPEQMLARVFTMFSTGGMAAAMAGMTFFGWAADRISPGVSLLGSGLFLFGGACFAVHFTFRFTKSTAARVPLRKLAVQTSA